jgi:hypothetical protein
MITRSELSVTLSKELLAHLRAEAKRLDVPLEWLVASLVCDTVDCSAVEPIAA